MMSQLSVCVLTTTFPLSTKNEAGKFVLEQCKGLVQNGIQVTVVAPHYPGSALREIMDGVSVRRFIYFFPTRIQKLCYRAGMPTNLKNSILAKLQVPFFLLFYLMAAWHASQGYDLIHCHWSPSGFIGVLVGKLRRKPVVVTMHHAEKNNQLMRFVLQRASYVIFNSTFTRNHTLDFLPVKNYSVIAPGIDFKRFRPVSDFSVRDRLDIPHNVFLIFAMGRLIELKGFEVLLKAFSQLTTKTDPDNLCLILGGEGPLRRPLEEIIRKNRLEQNVHLIGFIPPEKTPAYYSNADVFVMPSIFDSEGETEGLGLVLVEACACGTPCIASQVGGAPDVIQGGRNGWLVPSGNIDALASKIGELMNDPIKLKIASAECRDLVRERFEIIAVTRRISKVYDSIVKAG